MNKNEVDELFNDSKKVKKAPSFGKYQTHFDRTGETIKEFEDRLRHEVTVPEAIQFARDFQKLTENGLSQEDLVKYSICHEIIKANVVDDDSEEGKELRRQKWLKLRERLANILMIKPSEREREKLDWVSKDATL